MGVKATPESLADGQVSSTETVEYTVPERKKAEWRWLSLCNTHTQAVQVTVRVQFRQTGGRVNPPRRLLRFYVDPDDTIFVFEDTGLGVSAGDSLYLTASVDEVIDFILAGTEEPL